MDAAPPTPDPARAAVLAVVLAAGTLEVAHGAALTDADAAGIRRVCARAVTDLVARPSEVAAPAPTAYAVPLLRLVGPTVVVRPVEVLAGLPGRLLRGVLRR